MDLTALQTNLIPRIESQLKTHLNGLDFGQSQLLKDMLRYHMGWQVDPDQPENRGKRIRPLLALLSTGAFGEDVDKAMPGAMAIELLHNFTLIHDDIEDNSPLRHSRPTLWRKWGIAQAINAGDALFSIAQLSILSLNQTCGESAALIAARRMNEVCLHLTRGQYLDISFEEADNISIDAYLDMVRGKTAALIAFALELGGIVSCQDKAARAALAAFGENLGLAFQIQDDDLGVWGDPALTGKSAASDLIARKKTLPILYGLSHCETFRDHWSQETITPDNASRMADLLAGCGAQDYVRERAGIYTQKAFNILENLFPKKNIYASAILALAEALIKRRV
jgi:geranylgeranyl diphosphate synthase type I